MKQRDNLGRYTKVYRKASRWEVLTLYSVLGGILFAICFDIVTKPHTFEVVREAEAKVVEVVPEVVMIEVAYTKEDVERHIRATFPEDAETAVKVAKCESSLVISAKGPTDDHGVFQIHKPSWHKVAVKLGYENYATDLMDNLAMARYIYDNAGGKWTDWVCYTKGMI